MGEKLENIIDILTPRSLKTGWCTESNEGDTNVSDSHEIQVRMMVNFSWLIDDNEEMAEN